MLESFPRIIFFTFGRSGFGGSALVYSVLLTKVVKTAKMEEVD
jgi:hypothetical protein